MQRLSLVGVPLTLEIKILPNFGLFLAWLGGVGSLRGGWGEGEQKKKKKRKEKGGGRQEKGGKQKE